MEKMAAVKQNLNELSWALLAFFTSVLTWTRARSIELNPGNWFMSIHFDNPFFLEAKVAFEAATVAAQLCVKIRKNFDLNVMTKSDSSPVTRKR